MTHPIAVVLAALLAAQSAAATEPPASAAPAPGAAATEPAAAADTPSGGDAAVGAPALAASTLALDLTAPTAPAQLTAAALGETEVELRWTASTDQVGVAGYEVLRDGRIVAGGAALATRERGLRAYTEYCYAVRAFNAAGNRSATSPAACVRTVDATPPSTPQHVVASATSDRSVQVLWQASSDNVAVASYELLRDGAVVETPGGAWVEEQELHPGVRYCYTVRAVDPAGNRSAPSAAACAVTPDVTPPTVPDAVAVQAVSPSTLFVAWAPSSDDVAVDGYELVRDGDATSKVSSTDLVVPELASGRHCFRVRAVDKAGNRSALSDAICATTAAPGAPPAPFGLRAEAASDKSVRLSWHASPELGGVVYRVYWDGGKNIGATRLTAFNAVGLRPGEHHCYRVAAVDDRGHESPRTLEACAAARTESLSARE